MAKMVPWTNLKKIKLRKQKPSPKGYIHAIPFREPPSNDETAEREDRLAAGGAGGLGVER